MLLQKLILICNELDLDCISLEVSENNLPARHLYEKFGFLIVGVRKNYYQDNCAILMKKELETKLKY